MTARGALAGACIWAALTALAGCGKQEGALSPNSGAASHEPGAGAPTHATAPVNVPAAAGASTDVGNPRQTGGEAGLERLQRIAGAPFFQGEWVAEGGASRGSERAARAGQRRAKKGASSLNAATEPGRHRGPAIRQILRSVRLSLNADNEIRLTANGAVQTGRYTVDVIDAKTAKITARFESGKAAVTDVFHVRAQEADSRGRVRMQVVTPGSDPMMMIESGLAPGGP